MPFRFLLFVLALLSVVVMPPQSAGQSDGIPPNRRQHDPMEEARAKMEKDMQKRRNEDRQKEIKRDTEKLLELATQLKEYVDKSNEDILSLDVVKKAEEIEKYAHSVKEKMKTAE